MAKKVATPKDDSEDSKATPRMHGKPPEKKPSKAPNASLIRADEDLIERRGNVDLELRESADHDSLIRVDEDLIERRGGGEH